MVSFVCVAIITVEVDKMWYFFHTFLALMRMIKATMITTSNTLYSVCLKFVTKMTVSVVLQLPITTFTFFTRLIAVIAIDMFIRYVYHRLVLKFIIVSHLFYQLCACE